MKVGVMQPYIFPYIGYFQLINAVDCFVVYDKIKFTKSGWMHRNRVKVNGAAKYFSLPLKRASDSAGVQDRWLSDDFDVQRTKILRQIHGAYRGAPFFDRSYQLVAQVLPECPMRLLDVNLSSIKAVCQLIGIDSQLKTSGEIEIDHSLRGQDRVLAICSNLSANVYLNPISGRFLYSKSQFAAQGVDLRFISPRLPVYSQLAGDFVPGLSIVDVIMFCSVDQIREMILECDIYGA